MLIKIETNEQGEQLVSARELHIFLESKQDYSTWIKNRIEKYDFTENEDFSIILWKSSGGRPRTDYILKLDMAKELAMVENNLKGREARRYFIECEKNWNNPEMIMARALEISKNNIISYEENIKKLELKVKKDKPKVKYYDNILDSTNLLTTSEIALEFGMTSNKLNKILCELGVQFIRKTKNKKKYHLYGTLLNKGYHGLKKHNYTDNRTLELKTNEYLAWTQKGKKFIYDLLVENKYIPEVRN